MDNATLKVYYPNLMTLFDLISSHLVDIELLKEDDKFEYRDFLTTSVVNADTTRNFPQITKSHQDLNSECKAFDASIDRAIAILVKRNNKVPNVGTFGSAKPRTLNTKGFSLTGISTIIDCVRKSSSWLKLYKRIGEEAMVFLLTNYSIFLKLQNGCYIQLTGLAISKLPISSNLSSFTSMASNFYTPGQFTHNIQEVMHFEKEKIVAKINNDSIVLDENLGTQKKRPITDAQGTSSKANDLKRKHPNEDVERPTFKVTVLNDRDVVKVFNTNSISNLYFSRSVMFFGPPVYNKYDELWYGLPKEHILNVTKFSKKDNNMSNVVICYIFPRQFGLTNAFTNKEALPPNTLYHIYMDRQKLNNSCHEIPNYLHYLLPYVDHIIKRHNKCQYKNLLNTYCPIQIVNKTYCNTYQVTKFITAVLDFIIPPEFWGDKDNKTLIYKMVKVFIERRRFEELSLHEVLQGFKTKKCEWLVPSYNKKSCNNLEALKRIEILHEFIWWIFECFVIPLLKLNFHITHNTKHKYLLFYYRQEVWSEMVKQNLEPLIGSVFEKIPPEEVDGVLNGKKLGYSKLKFIPKNDEGNLRPIVNMKCPTQININQSSITRKNVKWTQSINTILNTTFQILKYEKEKNSSLLNGSIFSYNEVHKRLKEYKQSLANKNNCELYFAKVDIKCCFESIDHDKLMEIIKSKVLTETQYSVNKYEAINIKNRNVNKRRNYYVHNGEEFLSFSRFSHILSKKQKNAILIDNVSESYEDLNDTIYQLEEHIKKNIVKINNEYYKQVAGIPQGSILSSLLCSIYYGIMEQSELEFASNDKNGIILHLLDDFLYISTSKEKIVKFMKIMHEEANVNDKKSMTNFNLHILDKKINEVDHTGEFPWCGLLINTQSLNLKVDYLRYSSSCISNGLTIKMNHSGRMLREKMITFVTTKYHKIFYDTFLNNKETILINIYQNFLMAALKFHHYIKGMPRRNECFEVEVVYNAINHFYLVLCKDGNQNYTITKEEVMWLGAHAFLSILKKKKHYYQGIFIYFRKILDNSKLCMDSIIDLKNSLVFFNQMKF